MAMLMKDAAAAPAALSYPGPTGYSESKGYPGGWIPGNFETDFPSQLLYGSICARLVEADDPNSPASIIDANEPWKVEVYWKLDGLLKSMICGKWCVRVFLESLGADDLDLELEHDLIEVDPCGNGVYCATFDVEPNKVRVEQCGTPFKPVATVTYLTCCRIRQDVSETHHAAYRPGPIAGFVPFKVTQFFVEGVEIEGLES